ncbi:MAG: RnfABCDGE type electron transport complex subunit B [Lysobacterales bacterium]
MTGNPILDSALVLGGVGLFFGFLIAMANKKFYVWEDPRINEVEQLLPNSNCGACGQPGCRAFAEGLVNGKFQPSGCTVMGPDDISDVAGYLGVDAGEASKRVARLLCAGGKDEAARNSDYAGLESCKAASAVAGGGKACNWGCLGLGDCERACLLDAIFMNEDLLPVVIPERCTACNDCVVACPKDLFELMPIEQKLIVQCKNLLKGDAAEDLCSVACNTCNRCVADSEPGVIELINNLAVINDEKNELTDPKAVSRCPTGAIVWVEGQQFAESLVELEKKVV